MYKFFWCENCLSQRLKNIYYSKKSIIPERKREIFSCKVYTIGGYTVFLGDMICKKCSSNEIAVFKFDKKLKNLLGKKFSGKDFIIALIILKISNSYEIDLKTSKDLFSLIEHLASNYKSKIYKVLKKLSNNSLVPPEVEREITGFIVCSILKSR